MNQTSRYHTIRKATIISAITNTLLAIFKVIVGYLGHSHALVADGLHSFSDLISDTLVLVASKAGGRLPDARHPYGHHRIETFATILIALMLVGVAIAIIAETLQHTISATVHLLPEISVIVVACVSILANEGLYQYYRYVGNKTHSNLLLSNAWHNRSDAFTSIIVLISVIGSLFGFHYFDSIGATIIALFIAYVGVKMIWHAVSELIDTAVDDNTHQQILEHIRGIPGVVAVHQLRTRTHGGHIFVDVHILVSPFISVSEGHHIGERVHLSLCEQFHKIHDITVHIDPEDDEITKPSVHLPDRKKIEAQLQDCWQHLPYSSQMERIVLHYLQGQLHVEVYIAAHVKLNEQKTLLNRYRQAATTISDIVEITLHFRPEKT